MKRIFSIIGKWLEISRRVAFNALFLISIIIFLSIFFFQESLEIPKRAAMVLSPVGNIVDQKSYTDPAAKMVNQLFGEAVKEETLLRNIIDAVDFAKDDKRIELIVLNIDGIGGVGTSKLQEIGRSLKGFKESGKKVIATGDSYTQNQYYIAAHADEVYLHPMGSVLLKGYGIYRLYLKNALEKLHIQFHAFRAGSYKSSFEPFTRNDMSDEAKEANSAWLEALWLSYTSDVEETRGLKNGTINSYINNIVDNLEKTDGDPAKMAVDQGLVNELKTKDEMYEYLIELVGKDKERQDFNQIHFEDYLTVLKSQQKKPDTDSHKVGIIVARGVIMNGEQLAGKIGSESLSKLIRKARENKNVKAVVVRIDSNGGSAFASEVIRREIEITQKSGIPVVISMGSMATSGGYWISATADEIWASPTTITGSIGVLGAITTFNKSLNHLGLNNDGVGTTRMANAFDSSRPLNPLLKGTMQKMVENSYRHFIQLVSQGRNIPIEQVELISKGRVWDGKKAFELGLVDHLGDLDEATKSAAQLAKLVDYDVVYIKRTLTAKEEFFQRLNQEISNDLPFVEFPNLGSAGNILSLIEKEKTFISMLNDPNDIYALCLTCDVD